jgi:VIT1/CCC1 family predicted Fe2+/Mn2+ transporter
MLEDNPRSKQELHASHTPDAVRERLAGGPNHSYLKDFVYGGIDGAVTTFAVVSGVAGAELSSGIVLVLGFANLVGDGFSMAASNFMASRAELQLVDQARQMEEAHIRLHPEGEREEIRQIFQNKGFEGDNLEIAVDIVTSDKQQWVNTMLQEELGLALERPCPLKAATMTFVAFIVIGMLPLLAFVADYLVEFPRPFLFSTIMTGGAFFTVGAVKARFVIQKWYWAGLETMSLGCIAAALAYLIGWLLKGLV